MRVRASYNFSGTTSAPRWEWGPVVGVGVYHLNATSIVSPPFEAQTDTSWSFVANAGFDVQYFFAHNVSIGLDAGALALVPRPVIAVDDQRSSPIALQAQVGLSLGVAF